MRVDGKVVLITGASDGIGAACVHEFRKRGARVVLTGRSESKLREHAGSDPYFAGDLIDPDFRASLIDKAVAAAGRLDVLVNNAGAGLYVPAHRASMEDARRLFELNVFAPLDLAQRAVPHMKQQGGGAIVNVGSIAGKMTLPWFTLYSATKYALGSISDGLRMELRGAGIHTMTVCPGYVKTGFQKNVLRGRPPRLAGLRARWAITPEQCAAGIVRGLERNARTLVTPRSGWLLLAMVRLFPSLVDRSLESLYREQEAQA